MAYTSEQKGIRSIPVKSFGGMGVVGGRQHSCFHYIVAIFIGIALHSMGGSLILAAGPACFFVEKVPPSPCYTTSYNLLSYARTCARVYKRNGEKVGLLGSGENDN